MHQLIIGGFMLQKYRIAILGLFLSTLSFSADTILQNNDTYSGCEDGYLSAIYATPALIDMVQDTLTNHFADPEIYLSK